MLARARRDQKAAYPALPALGGAVLAFIPGAPRIVPKPKLALALFVAPLLDSHARAEEEGAPGERLRMGAVGAARRAILAMCKSGKIGDVAFHRLEEEMDRIEWSAT